jgi:hypothetical protein
VSATDLTRLGYALAVVQGLVTAIAPDLSLATTTRLLGCGFEHADDLTARPWYRRQVRATGVGLLAAGLAGLALEAGADERES